MKYVNTGTVRSIKSDRGGYEMMLVMDNCPYPDPRHFLHLGLSQQEQLAERLTLEDRVVVGWEPETPKASPPIDFAVERRLSRLRALCAAELAVITLLLMLLAYLHH